MGADIDAYQQGAQMGIPGSSTLSYSKGSTQEAFAASAQNTVAYAKEETDNLDYTEQQRLESGDSKR